MMQEKSLGAIVLAAGKGKRMNSKRKNKVALSLGGKPMIVHTVEFLKKLGIKTIVVVVGFAKKSVISALKNNAVVFAEQKKRLGTAHAASCGLKKLPKGITDVLVLQGDDSAFYKPDILKKLIDKHFSGGASLTFLTIKMNNPKGLGRIVKDAKGKILSIIEEKDATEKIRLIKEVNAACYIFQVPFLRRNLSKIKKSSVTGEYYLTSLIGLALSKKEKIENLYVEKITWRGVNTKEELEEAKRLFYDHY